MSQHVALLGMPHAGKTAWLGRLGLALLEAPTGALRADRPEDLRALRQLTRWMDAAKYPERSPLQGAPELELGLRWESGDGAQRFKLHISDYNGEEVEKIYKDRDPGWHRLWDQRAGARGLVVVIRPDQLRPLRARRVERLAPSLPGPADLFGSALLPDLDARSEEEPTGAPTGIALVELIQLLRHIRGLSMGQHLPAHELRLALVFSCWDAVAPEDQALGPDHLLRTRLGLLDDLLATCYPPGAVRCFGLSTTGGDLKVDDFKTRYERAEPHDWGWVCFNTPDGPRDTPDVTLPLAWILGGEPVIDTAPQGRGVGAP